MENIISTDMQVSELFHVSARNGEFKRGAKTRIPSLGTESAQMLIGRDASSKCGLVGGEQLYR